MVNESRISVYDYVCNLFEGVVSDNVYRMSVPQELNDDDVADGFVVIRVGDIEDASEFDLCAYGSVRVFVEAYVPPMSRGRLNKTKYKAFEDGINQVVREEIENGSDEHYSIQSDGIISVDDVDNSNSNNAFHVFVKSFIVTID